MKKLTCHCGGVEMEVKLPEGGFEKLIRCNCSLCKRKGFIMTFVGPDDVKIVKGQEFLKLYQYIVTAEYIDKKSTPHLH